MVFPCGIATGLLLSHVLPYNERLFPCYPIKSDLAIHKYNTSYKVKNTSLMNIVINIVVLLFKGKLQCTQCDGLEDWGCTLACGRAVQ